MQAASRRLDSHRAAIWCGVIAAFVGLLNQVASRVLNFHPSVLLNVAESDPLAAYIKALDPSFRFVAAVDHYDGIYFYAMARDPFALGQAHNLIDLAAYRYGHPMYSWVAGILSFGQAGLLPWVFWAMSLASMFAAGFLVAKLASRLGASPWLGLLVAASPGLLFSASTVLTEPAQVAMICAVLLVWLRPKPNLWLLAGLLVATCLLKEQLILLPFALLIDYAIKQLRALRQASAAAAEGSPNGQLRFGLLEWLKGLSWGKLAALAAGPFALGIWLFYVRGQFTAAQQTYDSGNVGIPLYGWGETFVMAFIMRSENFHASQIGSTASAGLLAIAVVLVAASVFACKRRDALSWFVLLQTGLIFCLGWRTLLFPHEMFRIPSVALVLAALLLAVAISAANPRPEKPTTLEAEGADPLPG